MPQEPIFHKNPIQGPPSSSHSNSKANLHTLPDVEQYRTLSQPCRSSMRTGTNSVHALSECVPAHQPKRSGWHNNRHIVASQTSLQQAVFPSSSLPMFAALDVSHVRHNVLCNFQHSPSYMSTALPCICTGAAVWQV